MIAHITFTQYFDYDVEMDEELYKQDPFEAEEKAIAEAYEDYCAMKRTPIADTTYDAVEIEIEGE